MITVHKPVLLNEVIKYLEPRKNQNFVDCTIGAGGHAEKILEKTGSNGKLLGIDWDPEAIARTEEKLKKYKKRLILINDSYTNLKEIVYDKKFFPINGVLLDLGLSSDQLQSSGRGFSFQVDEPLDMRYSPEKNGLTAAEIVNTWTIDKIKEILIEYAEEKFADRIARAIAEHRKHKKFETTMDLVSVLLKAKPKRKTKIHPATKTFQALRVAVNNELGNIKIALKDILEILEPGARLAVITFHSVEDRIVKQFFKRESRDCICPVEVPVCQCGHKAQLKLITKKPVIPAPEEVAANPRSRSAKLRVAEKVN